MKLILRANGKGYHLLIVYYVPDVYFRYLLFICSLLSGQFSNFLSFFLFFFLFCCYEEFFSCGPSQTRLHGHTKRIFSQEITPRSRNAGLEINECSALPNNMKLFSKVTVIMYTPTRMCKLSCWVTSSPTLGILVFLKQNFLLQEIFPIQGLKLGFLRCKQVLYHQSHQGSPFLKLFGIKWYFDLDLYFLITNMVDGLFLY